jgi:DNA-binding NtrC family response regulator
MKYRGNVLLVTSEHNTSDVIGSLLRRQGYIVTELDRVTDADSFAALSVNQVALVDQPLADKSAISTINYLKQYSPQMEVILLADHRTQLAAIEMIRDQLFSFHTKPLDLQSLDLTIQRAIGGRQAAAPKPEEPEPTLDERQWTGERAGAPAIQARSRTKAPPMPGGVEGIVFIGESRSIQQVRQLALEVAPTDMTVMLRGESGVGKGMAVRLIHAASGRGEQDKLIQINCTAIPDSLIESELFGHEAGAFTGAEKSKPGRFEFAAGGTIFLDEIGEIPAQLQVKLLNVIEQKEIYHLGGKKAIKVDARFVTATNAPLESLITVGKFRPDLFYRLNEFVINIPPLRERIEDLPVLIEYFCRTYGAQYGRPYIAVPPDMMGVMMSHKWPGNVRELETVIRRFCLSGKRESILELIQPEEDKPKLSRASLLAQNEVQTILAVLTENRWNQRRAAQSLGISYSALRRRIEKYNLKN